MTPRFLAGLLPMFAALTLCGLPAPSFAQASPAPAAPNNIKLSPAQQAQSQALAQKFNADKAALVNNASLTPAQKQTQYQAMLKTLDTNMLAILTPAQRAVVMKQRQKTAAFTKAHKSEYAQGQAIAAKLNKSLTPDEQAKMAKISQDTRNQMQQVDADTTLSAKAKAAKKLTIYNAGEAQALAVLTPAQQADLKKMQAMQKKLQAEAAGAK